MEMELPHTFPSSPLLLFVFVGYVFQASIFRNISLVFGFFGYLKYVFVVIIPCLFLIKVYSVFITIPV